jgi:hypothetical protein
LHRSTHKTCIASAGFYPRHHFRRFLSTTPLPQVFIHDTTSAGFYPLYHFLKLFYETPLPQVFIHDTSLPDSGKAHRSLRLELFYKIEIPDSGKAQNRQSLSELAAFG